MKKMPNTTGFKFIDHIRNGYDTPRTQKATGVLTLRDEGWNIPLLQLVQSPDQIQERFQLLAHYCRRSGKIFARPCPVRPRHGFVDSGIVKSISEAKEMFARAQAADPEAEMLLMQAIDATWSAIWVPGRVVIGPGHDGATSGHNSFGINLVANKHLSYINNLSARSNVKESEVPYIEVVSDGTQPYYVQVRGGPPLAGGGNGTDYVPDSMAVKHVVQAEGDLMEWETAAKSFEPGTAVWHPGGSMLSHYAVHSVLNHIPILISRQPVVGEQLEPTTKKPPVDMQSVLAGIGAATALPMAGQNFSRAGAVAAMLTGLHNLTAFTGHDGFWLGAGSVIMQRLGAVALIGEARHASNRKGQDRDQIYNEGLVDPFITRRRLHRAQWMFRNFPWRGGYGGNAWANCGGALLGLDETIRKFVQNPDTTNYTLLGNSLNNAVNQAHNGGWWLNKFCGTDLMDQAAKGDPRSVVSGIGVLGNLSKVPNDEIQSALAKWTVTRPVVDARREPETVLPVQRARSIADLSNTTMSNITLSYHASTTNDKALEEFKALKAKIASKISMPTKSNKPSATINIANITQAQVKLNNSDSIHVQYKTPGMKDYLTLDIGVTPDMNAKHSNGCTFTSITSCISHTTNTTSWADGGTSKTPYGKLLLGPTKMALGYCGFPIYTTGGTG